MNFLDVIPLPGFKNLELGATAVRALERYGDLVEGSQKPVSLSKEHRFDMMDDCLELVILRDDLPAGFEMSGLSLADFWLALLTVHAGEPIIDFWRSALGDVAMMGLREAARKRIGVMQSGCHLQSRYFWLPNIFWNALQIELPEQLVKLLAAANPECEQPRRYRFAVEVIQEVGIPGRKLPTRGLRYPKPRQEGLLPWLHLEHQRLQPQSEELGYEYAELQLCLPSEEVSYFSRQCLARNVFAYFRTTRFINATGQFTLVLDEVRSEWVEDSLRQARGESLLPRNVQKGRPISSVYLSPVPDCPVAEDWLELALDAFLDFAKKSGCALVAWVPGQIQHELDPNLSLKDAQSRYDRDVPQTLKRLLVAEEAAWTDCTVPYATYCRNVLMRVDGQSGHLVKPDGITPLTNPVKGREATFNVFRAHAEPVIESLPGIQFQQALPEDASEDTEEEFDPGHGNHWYALYDLEKLSGELTMRDLEDSRLIDRYPCVDVANGTDHAEEVFCLRWGEAPMVHDVLVVSDSKEGSRFMFSAYPVLLDGIRHRVTLDHFEPWPHGIEAWAHVHVTDSDVPVCFFDTRYYAGSSAYQSGQVLDVSMAGLAYFLRPIQMQAFEIKEGPLWEMDRQRRLDAGESEDDASRPVKIHMTGACIFLPQGGRNARDDAQFQGVIDAIDSFTHDGHTIYRLEMVVMKPDDQAFRLPVFVSEYVLDGYVPRLGEDVEGVLWLQGNIIGPADNNSENSQGE